MIKLTTQEEAAVLSFMKDAAKEAKYHLRLRGSVILKANKGYTIREISRSLNITSKTVWNCINRFKNEGVNGLYDRPRQINRLSESQCQKLLRMRYPGYPKVMRHNRKWSYPKLAEWAKQNWGIVITSRRLSQIIQQKIQND
jgi:transposase